MVSWVGLDHSKRPRFPDLLLSAWRSDYARLGTLWLSLYAKTELMELIYEPVMLVFNKVLKYCQYVWSYTKYCTQTLKDWLGRASISPSSNITFCIFVLILIIDRALTGGALSLGWLYVVVIWGLVSLLHLKRRAFALSSLFCPAGLKGQGR